MNNVPSGLIDLAPQASNFVLANMMTVNRNWDEPALTFIHQEIAYIELQSTVLRKRPPAPVTSSPIGYMNSAAANMQQMHPAMMQQFQQQQVATYKTHPLPPNSEHSVYVSYVEDGPYLFSIQLQSEEDILEKLMNEINDIPLVSLAEQPVPGYSCMARCLEDGSLCRAVVINMVEEKCKTYYVDFGNTDILPFTNIFQIPQKYVMPKVMSMRFTLAGLKKFNVTNEMKCAFKEFVTNKLLRLKVLKLDNSPVIQYCELYDGDMNIINILYDSSNDYKTIQISKGQKYNVIVSFITGCKKFFVQLKDHSQTLNNLMMTLVTTCETTANLQEFAVGTPCVGFYSGDNQWYRAQIISVDSNAVTVRYVDYGNEETVAPHYLKTIDPAYVKLVPAQAIECCLYGYQNMSFNDEIESVFESLTLECEFTMKVISKQVNDTLLVDLFDSTGNNVAALLIERLAAQRSQISPLPSQQITRALLLNQDEVFLSPQSERSFQGDKSPARSPEKPSWRNPNNDKAWKNAAEEKKSWRNTNNNEKGSWRNTDKSQPKNDRHDQRNQPKGDGKSNRFPDNKRSPRNGSSNFNSGSESEKSFSSRSGKKFNSKRDFKQNKSNDFAKTNETSVKRKVELPPQNLAALEEQYVQMNIASGTTDKVTISWFYNPENFYCQMLTNQKEFRDMMCEIQTAYNGRSGIISTVNVGSSVIAEFSEDMILYRATILENKHPKYKVQYIDFGNISLVDITKLWQVEQRFMHIPVQALKCSVVGVKSASETWPSTEAIDTIFNRDSFTATFETYADGHYSIQLYDNDTNIKQLLLDSGVAIDVTAALQMMDEAIDLNVLIGQNIYCHIRFIQGLHRFFVYLEKDKAAQVEESINAYMKTASVSSLQLFRSEELQVGATCLTKVAEDSWYRGVIRSTDNLEALQIDYPDIGDSGERKLDEIYMLPEQLCIYWYQAFECTAHNLSDTVTRLVTDEDFKTNYEGKDVLLYVDEIVENRIGVTLYEPITGTKINLFEPDEGAYPTVEPVCALPVLTNTLHNVWVSHVNNSSSIYLQRNSDIELLTAVLEKLFEFYEASEEEIDLSVGDLCCARSELDGNWYRGRVENKTNDTCTVLYIDYGNSETLPLTNLRSLHPQFYNTHELALNCGLNLKEISDDLTAKLTELTVDKSELKAVIFYAETGWLVDLFDGETSINQALIDLNLAAVLEADVAKSVEAHEVDVTLEVAETHVDEIRTSITITHVDSPSEFYVQLVANEKSIADLQADLQERTSTLPELEGADLGVLCAAKYSVDEQWYRAEVLDADADITTVRFVDFGNTDVINNNDGSVKTLPADLLAIDKYASKCSLDIQPAKGEEWPQEAVEMFENAVNGATTLHADIVYQDEKSKTFVELYIDGNNVAQQLLAANVALPIVRDAEESIASNTGFVSHLNSIAEFWIQLESSVPDLEMIVDRLASAETFPDLQDLSPGILCAANFPDDEMWYRARILSNTVAGIEVLFVDYGNSSTAMKLKVLPEDLVQMPMLAQKCALQKPTNISVWSEATIEKFREISADGVTIFTVKKLAAGETSVVELFMDGQNVMDQLVELCSVEHSSPIREPTSEKIHITHAESPSYFWVQRATVMDKIDEIMESLSAADSFERLVDWDPDTTCAARYTDSGLWYRAKILECTDQYEVLLIDYGNTLCTSEVRVLPSDLASVPPLATLCSLEYPPNVTDWSETACAKFADATANNCRAEFLDAEFPSTIRLFIDGKNVADEICSDVPLAPKQTGVSSTLTSETVALAESTPLPDLDGIEDEELDMPTDTKAETTLYEECDTTMKDEPGNASFLSCADDTTTHVDETTVDSSDTVESTHKMEDTNTTLAVELVNTNTDSNGSGNATLLTQLGDSEMTVTSVEQFGDHDVSNIDTEVASRNFEVLMAECTDNMDEDELVDKEIEEIIQQHDEEPEITRSRSVTPHSEKIVPGAVCRGDLEQVPLGRSRPATPHQEKIVPGAVCRGDLEQAPLVTTRPATPHHEKIVPGAVSRGDLEEISLVDVPNRPVTPHQDKIVPGTVCRGDVSLDDIVTDPTEDKQSADGHQSRPVTPHCEKIVPGSIARGDLAPAEKETIIKRSATPPIERGDLDTPLATADDKQTENQNIIP
ncbi:tudor [Carabus blaptoides fortunei]